MAEYLRWFHNLSRDLLIPNSLKNVGCAVRRCCPIGFFGPVHLNAGIVMLNWKFKLISNSWPVHRKSVQPKHLIYSSKMFNAKCIKIDGYISARSNNITQLREQVLVKLMQSFGNNWIFSALPFSSCLNLVKLMNYPIYWQEIVVWMGKYRK